MMSNAFLMLVKKNLTNGKQIKKTQKLTSKHLTVGGWPHCKKKEDGP